MTISSALRWANGTFLILLLSSCGGGGAGNGTPANSSGTGSGSGVIAAESGGNLGNIPADPIRCMLPRNVEVEVSVEAVPGTASVATVLTRLALQNRESLGGLRPDELQQFYTSCLAPWVERYRVK